MTIRPTMSSVLLQLGQTEIYSLRGEQDRFATYSSAFLKKVVGRK